MYSKKKITSLLAQVDELEQQAILLERQNSSLLQHIAPNHLESAKNLLHYLAIRAKDLTHLQSELSALAISSASHSESYTLNCLGKIKFLLSSLSGSPAEFAPASSLDNEASHTILRHNSEALFGKEAFKGQSRIMVTLPTEAGTDYGLVAGLVKEGMHIARINTAHDDAETWLNMINLIRKAEKETGKQVRIYMDLEGPKIRTGKIKPKTQAGKSKPKTPSIHLYKGDHLTLLRDLVEGHGGENAAISVTLPEIFGQVKANERIWFDDGKLGAMAIDADDRHIVAEITVVPEKGFKLKEEKGINFPDSSLHIAALTAEDLDHLRFIAQYADMVGFSFVQKPEDVHQLQQHMAELKRTDLGLILKIETHLAFQNLPQLLFAAMESPRCGLMIARGDLAVEIGMLRIAEVQEEIMWLAEAAHMPVIWATQVLETQIKKGLATRAEISDVVKAVRAECVMLNKGPHILEAIDTVKDIDKRMAAHEDKKRKILRSLHVAEAFVQ